MSRTKERVRLAVRMHERIRQSLKEVRATKIDAYLLLREFKRAKLYRWLDVAIAPGHAARGRRKPGVFASVPAARCHDGRLRGCCVKMSLAPRRGACARSAPGRA